MDCGDEYGGEWLKKLQKKNFNANIKIQQTKKSNVSLQGPKAEKF